MNASRAIVLAPTARPPAGGAREAFFRAVRALYWSLMRTGEEQAVPAAEADRRDVEFARGGDGDAFARLIARHEEAVARQMWRFTRDPRAHAELVQDVFVAAFTSLRGYRGEGPFLHWLRKIAVRAGMAHWRERGRAGRAAPLAEDLPARFAEEPAGHSAAEAAELVHKALGALPPRDRLVVTLMHIEERSVAETAELTGWSETLVKVQAWRARRKLRKLLEGVRDVE
jgi:RNA polymerase sigma-70 factor (ECF subfamily)